MTRRKPAGGRTGVRKIKRAGDSTPGPKPLAPADKRSVSRSVKMTRGEERRMLRVAGKIKWATWAHTTLVAAAAADESSSLAREGG